MRTFPFKIGDKLTAVSFDDDNYIEVLFIGEKRFFGKRSYDDFECIGEIFDLGWKLYTPPKKTVRMAPALNKFIGTERYFITSDIFKDEESAKNSLGVYFIKWPASESMFVDVPVEENNG